MVFAINYFLVNLSSNSKPLSLLPIDKWFLILLYKNKVNTPFLFEHDLFDRQYFLFVAQFYQQRRITFLSHFLIIIYYLSLPSPYNAQNYLPFLNYIVVVHI